MLLIFLLFICNKVVFTCVKTTTRINLTTMLWTDGIEKNAEFGEFAWFKHSEQWLKHNQIGPKSTNDDEKCLRL